MHYISVNMRHGEDASEMDNSIFIIFHAFIFFHINTVFKQREGTFSKFDLSCLSVELMSSRLEIFISCKGSDILR